MEAKATFALCLSYHYHFWHVMFVEFTSLLLGLQLAPLIVVSHWTPAPKFLSAPNVGYIRYPRTLCNHVNFSDRYLFILNHSIITMTHHSHSAGMTDIITYRYNGELVYVPVALDYTVNPALHGC